MNKKQAPVEQQDFPLYPKYLLKNESQVFSSSES